MPTEFTQININDLLPSPYQIRDNDNLDLEGLTANIQEDGIKNPIRVRPFEGKYQVASGHRRLAGARLAGLKAVWCLVEPISDLQMAKEIVVENVQRKSLTTNEQYIALETYRKMEGWETDFYSKLARAVGMSPSWITQIYNACDIKEKVKITGILNAEKIESIPVSTITATSGLQESDKLMVLESMIENSLSVSQLKSIVETVKTSPEENKTAVITAAVQAVKKIKPELSAEQIELNRLKHAETIIKNFNPRYIFNTKYSHDILRHMELMVKILRIGNLLPEEYEEFTYLKEKRIVQELKTDIDVEMIKFLKENGAQTGKNMIDWSEKMGYLNHGEGNKEKLKLAESEGRIIKNDGMWYLPEQLTAIEQPTESTSTPESITAPN